MGPHCQKRGERFSFFHTLKNKPTMSSRCGQSRDMSKRPRGSFCAAEATLPAASPMSTYWVWHQNIVLHFALCPLCGNKEATHLNQDSSEYICVISQRHAMLLLFFFPPACRLKPWWRWLGSSLRKLWINSMFCPWPLAPPSSVAFFDGLHMFTFHFCFLFPFYRVSRWVERETGLGAGLVKTRRGKDDNNKRSKDVGFCMFCYVSTLCFPREY